MKNKSQKKFVIMVVALILASVLLLVGCMSAIGSDKDKSKPYEMDSMESEVSSGDYTADFDDYVFPPSELDLKFSEMSVVNEESNSIMVITNSYLTDYWKDNVEEEVIHSLTAEEIRYIINDTIHLYTTYNTIVFPNFEIKAVYPSAAKDPEVMARIPEVAWCNFTGAPNWEEGNLTYSRYKSTIYEIICLRIALLSSPKAYILPDEVDLMIDLAFDKNSYEKEYVTYPGSAVYIPGYSADTDRDHFVSLLEGSAEPDKEDEWLIFSDLVSQIYFRTTQEDNGFYISSYFINDKPARNDLYVVYPDNTEISLERWLHEYEREAEIYQAKLNEKQQEYESIYPQPKKEDRMEYFTEIETLRNSLNEAKQMIRVFEYSLEQRVKPSRSYEEWLAQQDK